MADINDGLNSLLNDFDKNKDQNNQVDNDGFNSLLNDFKQVQNKTESVTEEEKNERPNLGKI